MNNQAERMIKTTCPFKHNSKRPIRGKSINSIQNTQSIIRTTYSCPWIPWIRQLSARTFQTCFQPRIMQHREIYHRTFSQAGQNVRMYTKHNKNQLNEDLRTLNVEYMACPWFPLNLFKSILNIALPFFVRSWIASLPSKQFEPDFIEIRDEKICRISYLEIILIVFTMFCITVIIFRFHTMIFVVKKLNNKRPMGQIAHLKKQFKSINTKNYIITLIRKRKNQVSSFLWIEWFLTNNFESLSPTEALCQI